MSGYSARLKWFDAAVDAFEAASKLPKFPGDPSPLAPLLDKLVNRLYSECHDGDPIGTTGCPVCRAWRTEQAERSEASTKALFDAVNTRVGDAELKAEQLTDVVEAQSQKLTKLAKDLALANERVELAEMMDFEATKQRDEALQERAEAQKHVVDLSARLEAAESEGKLYYDRFVDLRTALRELA